MATTSPSSSFTETELAPCARPLPSLADYLAKVPDHRQSRGRRHLLCAILCLICAALLAGRDHARAICEWGRDYPQEHMKQLGFTRKTPAASTLHLILKGLNWPALEEQLRLWAEEVLTVLGADEGVALAADGKTLRGSLKQGSEITHILSVMVHGLQITLTHEAVKRKSNEIPALPELLTRLLLSRRVVTVDALLTQRPIAKQIIEAGGEYVMAVKGNQPGLQEEVKAVFAQDRHADQQLEIERTVNRGHGRYEERCLTVVTLREGEVDWPGAAQVFHLERIRCPRKNPCPETAVRTSAWGVTSLTREEAGAERLLALTRGHWGIENGSHWVRDRVFREDESQVATGTVALAMAALRTAALSVFRAHGKDKIAASRRRCQARPDEALKLIGIT
jgi:predicted transposase YbfD/YdcC